MQRFLIIQTAFIGDVVLATALVEKLSAHFPDAEIDFMLRKGCEALLSSNPHLRRLHIWDKGKGKLRHLWKLSQVVQAERYTTVINVHRGATTGFVTWRSRAKERRGFSKNPFSWCYTHRFAHIFSKPGDPAPIMELERTQQLIADITDTIPARPKMYPSEADFAKISGYTGNPFICIAPSSVWATKRFPPERWAELIQRLPSTYPVYLLGGPEATEISATIISLSKRDTVQDLCGALSIMESVALMSRATMNYANDSGPLHFASAVNAPVTAVYCSTDPCLGFGPASDVQGIASLKGLYCKPCGLHGHRACPQGHFRCAKDLQIEDLLWWISPKT